MSDSSGSDVNRGLAAALEQLIRAYRQMGRESEARRIAIAKQHDLRGTLSSPARAWNRFLGVTLGHGYETWRPLVGLLVLYLACAGVFLLAQQQRGMIPTRTVPTVATLRQVPAANRCTSDYPCFSPFGYAVDTVIPLIVRRLRDTPRISKVPHSPARSRDDLRCSPASTREDGVAKRIRQDCAQLNLRLETAERDRVRAAIPRGSFNAVAVQLLMDHVQMIEAQSSHIPLPRENSAA